RFLFGDYRSQSRLFPERLDDYLGEENPVRAIDVFVDELDLAKLGFGGVEPETTGRPAYHPATMLKIYVYGYINQIQSSRRLERETARNVEMMWLTSRLEPDFKTIADFRKNNGPAIRQRQGRSLSQLRGGCWSARLTSRTSHRFRVAFALSPARPTASGLAKVRPCRFEVSSLSLRADRAFDRALVIRLRHLHAALAQIAAEIRCTL